MQDNVPPLQWQHGAILNLYPGRDDVVRVIDVRTPTSILHRAVTSLARLPIRREGEPIARYVKQYSVSARENKSTPARTRLPIELHHVQYLEMVSG
ncbi:hypothetical protein EVAR_68154_1 [Eumeta japonica]|uniref:DUF5641 domain-containing protein n=1 Tax=Eumeta variegata TaxID=151549 RepID=A0A4C1SST9_EUMVA|nr:hypothetical protein EVAR_68154_1 [Eumeta japonica]